MQSLGFENYTEALKIYLGKYREVSYPIEILFNANANCVICQTTKIERTTATGKEKEDGQDQVAQQQQQQVQQQQMYGDQQQQMAGYYNGNM